MNAAKEAIANDPIPANFVDISTIVTEGEVPCRTASALPFIGPTGIFTGVKKEKRTIPNPRGGTPLEAIIITLALNQSHRIKPGANVPNCNMDGVQYLPAKSINVSAVSEVQYQRNETNPGFPNAVTDVQLIFTRSNKAQPATLGVRVKFEEGVGQTPQFNPKRANGTVSFP